MWGRRILTGLSLGAGMAVCVVALFVAPGPQPWPALCNAMRGWLVLAGAIAVAETLFRGLRLCVVTRAAGSRIPLWTAARVTLAGDFAGAVTPSRFGGEPARLFALIRNGVSAGAAGAVLFGEFATDLIALGLLITTAFAFSGGAAPPRSIWGPAALLASVAVAVASAVHWPESLDRYWLPIARRRPVAWALRSAGLEQFQMTRWVVEVRRRLYRMLATGWERLAVALFYAMLHTVARFSILPLLAAAFGVRIGLGSTIFIQLAIFYGFALVPTPGGSGVPEIAFIAAFSLAAPSAPVGLLLVLWRFLTYYLGGALGGFLAPGLFRQAGRDLQPVSAMQGPEARAGS